MGHPDGTVASTTKNTSQAVGHSQFLASNTHFSNKRLPGGILHENPPLNAIVKRRISAVRFRGANARIHQRNIMHADPMQRLDKRWQPLVLDVIVGEVVAVVHVVQIVPLGVLKTPFLLVPIWSLGKINLQ